jgi:LPS sulfotransferase NodH
MSSSTLQRYVILSTPRSGSSHLVAALEAHPQVACLGEIFNTHGGALKRLGHYNERMMTMLADEPLQYLQTLMDIWSDGPEAKPVFGFKMMLHHDERVIDHLVADTGWRVILLRRDNVLAQWSSLQIAKITGEWSSKGKKRRAEKGIEEPEAPRIEFKPKAFEAYCAKVDARYDAIKRRVAGRMLFEVATEQVDARRDAMLAFLGVDPQLAAPAPGAGERQNSSSLEDRFANPDVLRRYAEQHHIELKA